MQRKKRILPNNMTEEKFKSLPIRCQRLFLLRTRDNYSQADIAEKIGVTVKTYRTWEIGEYKNGEENFPELSIDALKKLADVYEVSCDYILGKTDITQIDNNYINKSLGLSEYTIMKLKDLSKNKENILVIDELICHYLFEGLIKKIRNYLHSSNTGIVPPNALDEDTDNDSLIDNDLQPINQRAVYKFIISDTLNKMLEDIFKPYEEKGQRLFVEYCARQIFDTIFNFMFSENDAFLKEAGIFYKMIIVSKVNHPIMKYSFEEITKNPREIWQEIYGYELPEDIEDFDFSFEYMKYSLFD